jgi:energy-converting hydrogenase Eha subunit A
VASGRSCPPLRDAGIALSHRSQCSQTRAVFLKKMALIAATKASDGRSGGVAVMEILHVITLFNPMRMSLSVSVVCVTVGVAWGGTMLVIRNEGVSVGALLAITTGILCFSLGLVAEQLSAIRRSRSTE